MYPMHCAMQWCHWMEWTNNITVKEKLVPFGGCFSCLSNINLRPTYMCEGLKAHGITFGGCKGCRVLIGAEGGLTQRCLATRAREVCTQPLPPLPLSPLTTSRPPPRSLNCQISGAEVERWTGAEPCHMWAYGILTGRHKLTLVLPKILIMGRMTS